MSQPNDPYFQPPGAKEYYEEPPKKGHGCFFWGCIISLILLVLLIVGIALMAYFGLRAFNQVVEQYTDTAPMPMPTVEMPEEEAKSLRERVDAFQKALDAGEAASLELTGDELTTLINEKPQFKDKIAVTIEGDEIFGMISYPLDEFQIPLVSTKGRYLNGKAGLKASLRDGVLLVTLHDLEVKGEKVPEEAMQSMRQKNLAENAFNDPDSRRMLQRIETLEVKDGKVVIKSKAEAKEEDAKNEPSSESETGESSTPDAAPVEVKPGEEPKATEPAVEELKATEPAVVEPKATEPAVEEPKVTEPAVEEPKVEEPKVTEPAVEEPKVEEPKVTEPAVEEPKVQEPGNRFAA